MFDREPLRAALRAGGFGLGDAAFVRIFKREGRLELWLWAAGAARFQLFRSYPILKFSGVLGPKLAEGDLQAPEGFYAVGLDQLNLKSGHHLAFNLGFPNEYDRAHGRTGSFLMVHGGDTSRGCYAIGDAGIDEIYAVVEAALLAGQSRVHVHAFPFVLSDTGLAEQAGHRWAGFWARLKDGSDWFERAGVPPAIALADGDYCFERDPD